MVERRGRKVAVVAVARRLAGILWAMWRKNAAYDPARLGAASAVGLAGQAQNVAATATAMRAASTKSKQRMGKMTRALRTAMTAEEEVAT